ncbi:MAG: phosphatase PAP2 family protein [Gemmatimonadales bacterium]
MDGSEAEAPAAYASARDATTGPAADGGGSRPVRLVDHMTSIYNALLALIWLCLIPQWSYSVWLALAHAAAALLPKLLARTRGKLSPAGRVLADIYPLIFILAFWTELDLVRRLLHDSSFDRVIAGLDLAVFGVHLDQVWLPAMPWLWFSEIMHFAYFSYYFAVILPLLYMALRGSAEMKRDMTFRVMLVYLACFFIYIAFPVDGPHFLSHHYEGPHQAGFFYKLDEVLQGQGDALGCSFPSSHVAATTTMAYLGIRWLSKPAAVLLVLSAVGVALSTFYAQHHYAIDSLAGIILALWLQLLVAPALLRWWRCYRLTAAADGRSLSPPLPPPAAPPSR